MDVAIGDKPDDRRDIEARISLLEAALAERDATLSERDATLSERDATLSERDVTLRERDVTLCEQARVAPILVASVLFGIAEIELEYRRERQAAGIHVAKKRGVYQGRKKGTTKATPARAIKLRNRGLTAAEIVSALNVSPRTVFRYLAAE